MHTIRIHTQHQPAVTHHLLVVLSFIHISVEHLLEQVHMSTEIGNYTMYDSIDKILHFYQDLTYFRNNPDALEGLKKRIIESKKKKKKPMQESLSSFQLISDDEDN